MCDHIVVWAVQGLVRAAVARRPPLDQGQLLRLRACRDTLSGTLEACSQRESSAPDGPGEGGGMYERRLGFLDDIIELLTVPQDELEGNGGGASSCVFVFLPCCVLGMLHASW